MYLSSVRGARPPKRPGRQTQQRDPGDLAPELRPRVKLGHFMLAASDRTPSSSPPRRRSSQPASPGSSSMVSGGNPFASNSHGVGQPLYSRSKDKEVMARRRGSRWPWYLLACLAALWWFYSGKSEPTSKAPKGWKWIGSTGDYLLSGFGLGGGLEQFLDLGLFHDAHDSFL